MSDETERHEPKTAVNSVESDIPKPPLAEFTSPLPNPTESKEDMPITNKEVIPTSTDVSKTSTTSTENGIFSIMYTACKKVALVGAIYFMGRMGWSVAWLVAPVILSVARDQFRKATDKKREIAKASALASEKDIILARIDELPAWVYFPDVERCEWVNKVLKQVWPNANHYARTLVKHTIEQNVALSLAYYKLNGFRFDRIILGTIPPRIGGIKIYDKNVDRNEIIMDLDLFYASDCDINFYLSGVKGGIKDFQIHGWVRVIMKPLIRSMPLIGGLQIFFLNNPNIDFNLVGVIDFMDMPGLSDLLRRIIVEQISNIMVLPNKIAIPLSEEVPATALKMPEPEGILRIHVIEAKDLMKKDIGVLGKGKSDPYALINVGAQEFKSPIVENNVNPKWDYWCEAKIFVEMGQYVDIHIYDMDDTSNDELLGRASVEIINVVQRGVVDTWLTLENAKHGLLHVRLHWCKLTANTQDLRAALLETQLLRVSTLSTALLTVFIDSAKNLKQARANSKPDPYLICSVGKQKEQTAMIMRNDSPVWEQGFSFLVSNPDNDAVQIHIHDQKTGIEIGQFTYILSALLTKKNMEIMSQPFQLQKSGPESKIIMSLSLRILQSVEAIPDESTSGGESASTEVNSGSNSNRPITEYVTNDEEFLTTFMSNTTPPRSPKGTIANALASVTPSVDQNVLTHRVAKSTGDYGLGRIQLSIRYMIQRQKLVVTIHKIMNIPLRDPSSIPDPYVKLYLLPGRSKDSKRKTAVIKDNCNPVYDSTFEYLISSAELNQTELEVTVCSQKGFLLYGGSPIIGMLKLPLNDPEISTNGISSWFNLQSEIKHE